MLFCFRYSSFSVSGRPGSSAAVSPVSGRKVKPLKIKVSGPQRGVHAATVRYYKYLEKNGSFDLP